MTAFPVLDFALKGRRNCRHRTQDGVVPEALEFEEDASGVSVDSA
jgi:hypothetical protein